MSGVARWCEILTRDAACVRSTALVQKRIGKERAMIHDAECGQTADVLQSHGARSAQADAQAVVPGRAHHNLSSLILARPVFLIGFMGAGKTSTSQIVANRCKLHLLDVDKELENEFGCSIAQIFKVQGEEWFRTQETRWLKELSCDDSALISCGGGMPLREENRRIMRQKGLVVYLRVSAETAAVRIKDTSSRPLFRDLKNARNILDQRMPLYEQAAHEILETEGKTPADSADELIELLLSKDILRDASTQEKPQRHLLGTER